VSPDAITASGGSTAQNQAAFVAAARSSNDAELTPCECAEFFDALCG
jgi:hypothetical protein